MGDKVKLKRKETKEAKDDIGTLQRRLSIACRHLKTNAGKVVHGTEPTWFQDIMKEKVDGDDGDESDLDNDAEDDEARSEGGSSESCLHWAQGRCERDRCQYRHTMDLESGYNGGVPPSGEHAGRTRAGRRGDANIEDETTRTSR